MSSQESAPVIDGLKEEIFRVIRDKVNLELEVKQLSESLKVSRNEEARMRAKVLELEESVGMAVEKEEEMARTYSALVSEKNEMERMLTEKRDSHEYEIAELLGEVGRVRDVMDELKGSNTELVQKNEQLLSQVDEVMLEKDNMRKGFEEEKDKVETLEMQVVGMKGKLEQAEAKLVRMRNEGGKLSKRNKELENNVDVLKKEKEALQNTLLECDDLIKDVRNKRSSPTEEEASLRKKGKFELSHVQRENVFESDPDLRRSKEDNCSPLNSNASSGPNIDQFPDTVEEEKDNENLELQVAGMKEKLEKAEAKLGKMRFIRNEREKELLSNVDVLMKEKDAMQNTLLEAQWECDDLNRVVRNKRSSPTKDPSSLKKKGKFELSHVTVENLLESNLDLIKSKEDNCSPLNSNAPSQVKIIEYPDTDFKDFDKDRGEDCFAANQFWAIYDNFGMPRYIALVRKVATPFKLKISWLKPDPDDQGEIDWRDADLPIACGKFKLGSSKAVTDREIFSHQIPCLKRTDRGSYMVYPNKGEIWAIFRYWDIKWSSNPENHLLDEFEYVEILSDFNESADIEVAYLVKVEGFASLFQKTRKNGVIISYVLPNELYSFSHRIPSYKMTGNEREGVPRGCFELDTAALPTNLFDVGDSGLVEDLNRMLHTGGEKVMANESITTSTNKVHDKCGQWLTNFRYITHMNNG